MSVTARSPHRVSLAVLVTVKPGERPRLLYRAHAYRGRKDDRKGFDEGDYIRLLGVAHQRLGSPIVVGWDKSGHPPLGPDAPLPGRPELGGRRPG